MTMAHNPHTTRTPRPVRAGRVTVLPAPAPAAPPAGAGTTGKKGKATA